MKLPSKVVVLFGSLSRSHRQRTRNDVLHDVIQWNQVINEILFPLADLPICDFFECPFPGYAFVGSRQAGERKKRLEHRLHTPLTLLLLLWFLFLEQGRERRRLIHRLSRKVNMATTVAAVSTPPRIIPLEEGWEKEIKEKVRRGCFIRWIQGSMVR